MFSKGGASRVSGAGPAGAVGSGPGQRRRAELVSDRCRGALRARWCHRPFGGRSKHHLIGPLGPSAPGGRHWGPCDAGGGWPSPGGTPKPPHRVETGQSPRIILPAAYTETYLHLSRPRRIRRGRPARVPRCIVHVNGSTTVELGGEVDLAVAHELAARLEAVIDASSGNVDVDLAQVRFLDSSGLKALVSTHRRLCAEGRQLTFAAPAKWCTGCWRSAGSPRFSTCRVRPLHRGTRRNRRQYSVSTHTRLPCRLVPIPTVGSARRPPEAQSHQRGDRRQD